MNTYKNIFCVLSKNCHHGSGETIDTKSRGEKTKVSAVQMKKKLSTQKSNVTHLQRFERYEH